MKIIRVKIVKNELGGSATQQELRHWGVGGHNGMNRRTGGVKPQHCVILSQFEIRCNVILFFIDSMSSRVENELKGILLLTSYVEKTRVAVA